MKQNKGLIIVVILAVVILAAGVVVVMFGSSPGSSVMPSSGTSEFDESISGTEDDSQGQREIDETKAADRVDTSNTVSIVLKQDGTKVSGNGVQVQNNQVKITKAGSYELSGSLTEGQIYVEAGGKDTVVLLLNNVELSNSSAEVIHVENAGETILLLPENTKSTVRSGKQQEIITVADTDSTEVSGGAVYSRDDLTISGDGELMVGGYLNNGIQSTNHLRIDSGTINVEAVHHAVKGKDWVTITGGVLHLTAGQDGITSNNDVDEGCGMVDIAGGEMHIAAGDDGIHAEREMYINKGTIDITKSYEGLEANQITIEDGQIAIESSDDGMNAYGGQDDARFKGDDNTKTTDEMPNLIIRGGDITVNAEGDGLDSNGNLIIEGGNILVNGPDRSGNGALDTGGQCLINGGTILALSNGGMEENFEESSEQCSFIFGGSSFAESTKITINDSDGNTIYEYITVKPGNSVVFSSPELKKGDRCTITIGDTSEEIALDAMSNGNSGFSGRGGAKQGGGMHQDRGTRPDSDTPPEHSMKPDGNTPPERGRKPKEAMGAESST